MDRVGRRIEIRGTVQGVGFRPWVFRLAREEGVGGSVRNDAQGVTIEAYGAREAVGRFLHRLESAPPRAAQIRALTAVPIAPEAVPRFTIVESRRDGERRVAIPPDLATCADCARELADAGDRRFEYAFTNCTNCGPRFTILRELPYDRRSTTMAPFRMCADCRREYEDPADRRFHAEPNACPACGPRLQIVSPRHEHLPANDAIRAAACYLQAERIVAVKGLGGFHLACDATSTAAVARLRRRKLREQKPFAVMVRDLAAAERLAVLTDPERALLRSVERPIVLVRRRPEAPLSPEVAPDNPLVGLILPYSPVHHLLLEAAERPLVMTSGNLSDEPIAYRDAEAVERLGPIADAFVLHDRDIANPCDDSVTRVIAGRPTVLRRSRGYVPRPVPVRRAFAKPVLACGGHLKNAFCIGLGDAAYFGAHVGDLENLETVRAFEEAVERLERLLGVEPEIVAHDLHPGYLSTAYALARPGPLKVGVQHHHAHVASALGEHGIEGPVIGVAYDGTGYGRGGGIWGGEILRADLEDFDRLATFRPVALPGGEAAIRDVWRLALAVLHDAYDGRPPLEGLPLFQGLPGAEVEAVRAMLAAPALSPRSHGVGRYFDALGALVLGRRTSHHEGQVALAWNVVADEAERGRYPYEIDTAAEPWTVDLRLMVRAALADMKDGVATGAIAARFHNTLAAATAQVVRHAEERLGRLPVVLTGGCFQNALLAERTLEKLAGRRVLLHGQVPPGDGGLALGQALIADALTRRGDGGAACV